MMKSRSNNRNMVKFLASINLVTHSDVLTAEGFADMNDLMRITFEDLLALNFSRGHARRLLDALTKYNNVNEPKQSLIFQSNSQHTVTIEPGRIPPSKNACPLNLSLLLLGDSGSGKTSLRRRMESGEFEPTPATIGVDLTLLKGSYVGSDLQISVWDPAGQERYNSITRSFFRRAHGAAIVFAADDESSWKSVEYWMSELDENAADDMEIMLICNKIDTIFPSNHNPNRSIKQSQITDTFIKYAIEVAQIRKIPFIMASAKSGTKVQFAFQQLVSQALSNERIIEKLYANQEASLQKHGKSRLNRSRSLAMQQSESKTESDDTHLSVLGRRISDRFQQFKRSRNTENQSSVSAVANEEFIEVRPGIRLDERNMSMSEGRKNRMQAKCSNCADV